MSQEPIISLENVAVRLGSRIFLKGTTWRIRPGENWALLGPNGSGKTSLAKTIAGLLPVVQGRITTRLAGPGRSSRTAGAGAIGYVSPEQHKELLRKEERVLAAREYSARVHEVTTVADIILERAAAEGAGGHSRLSELTQRLEIQHLLDTDIQSISSGEMRKTLIARALIKNPRLLILDEPFDGLDQASRRSLVAIIEHLMAGGVQVVLVTHRAEEIVPGISHLMLLEDGSVRHAGRREDVLRSAPQKVAGILGLAAGPRGSSGADPHADDGTAGRELIRMVAVSVSYAGACVLDHVDWTMRSGENWMIAGPNGAGKSTLLKLIFGEHPQAYANEIYLFGKRVGSVETVWDIKARIGFVSSHLQARYRRDLRALDVVRSGFFDSVGLYRTCTPQQEEAARRWVQTLGIGELSGQWFNRLSYGQRQLVLLARAMVKSPPLLILDEPCDGLDGERRLHLLGLLDRIGSQTGSNLLYVTHQPEERPACISHTLRLERGRVVENSAALQQAHSGVAC
jgi:molybdate transport system ATP-binding protein